MPKNCRHNRFITTRAVSGFSFETSQSARSSRVAGRPGFFTRKAGSAGDTFSPVSMRKFPRGRIRTVRGWSLRSVTRQRGSFASKSDFAWVAAARRERRSASSGAWSL